MRMIQQTLAGLVLTAALGATAGPALAHCEIPCGIYGDLMRFQMIEENLATIEKSMKAIAELQKEPAAHMNQIVRWVQNKEHHADAIRDLVSQYFLAQRVKPAAAEDEAALAKYHRQLELLHRVIVEAMKAKQTLDLEHVAELRSLLARFHASYFGKEEQKHLKEHHGAK